MERGDVRLLIEAQARLNQGEGRLPVTNLTRPLRHYDVTALRVGGGMKPDVAGDQHSAQTA